MPTTTDTTVVQQLHDAVFQARTARHHPTCSCSQYRDAHREGFCTPAEWRFSQMADRLIDKARAEHETSCEQVE